MATTLTVPTVHLNGTGQKGLLEQLETAISAVDAATDAVAQAAPHGRDYYVQGPDAYSKARAEHDARLAKLQNVSYELGEVWSAVDAQRRDR